MRIPPILAALAVITLTRTAHADVPSGEAATSETASPSDLESARSHFRSGVQLYRERDFHAALAEFNRAYALGPSYRILYNIGQAQLEAQDCPAALKTFARYLAEGGTELSSDQQAESQRVIATCSLRVAEIRVHVTTGGRERAPEIFVDDVSVGRLPFTEPLMVGVGRRRVSALLDGVTSLVQVIEVAGGDRVDVDFAFAAPPPAPAHAPTPTPAAAPALPPPPPPQGHAAFWVSLGVTGALGAAALTTGVLSLSAGQRMRRELDTFPTDDAAVRSARTDVKTTAVVTDVLGLAALAGVGVTTYFALKTFASPKSDKSLRVGIGAGSFAAEGSF